MENPSDFFLALEKIRLVEAEQVWRTYFEVKTSGLRSWPTGSNYRPEGSFELPEMPKPDQEKENPDLPPEVPYFIPPSDDESIGLDSGKKMVFGIGESVLAGSMVGVVGLSYAAVRRKAPARPTGQLWSFFFFHQALHVAHVVKHHS